MATEIKSGTKVRWNGKMVGTATPEWLTKDMIGTVAGVGTSDYPILVDFNGRWDSFAYSELEVIADE